MPLLSFVRQHGKMRYLSTLLVKKCLILCLCGAVSAPLCRGDWPVISPSTQAEHLLIYRIQSHTNPKRRKDFLKQAGQKSSKEELAEQRKASKRAIKCRLKVPTHIWEQGARVRATAIGKPGNPWDTRADSTFPLACNWSKNDLDHMFDHNWKTSQPGVAQLVARLLWEQDAGSSSLPTRTKTL